MNDLILFGKNVRAARESANISREKAAELAGITSSYLGEIERGEKWPALEIIRSIAQSLGVSAAVFFEFQDQEAATPIDEIHSIVEGRPPEQQQLALRLIRVLFRR